MTQSWDFSFNLDSSFVDIIRVSLESVKKLLRYLLAKSQLDSWTVHLSDGLSVEVSHQEVFQNITSVSL